MKLRIFFSVMLFVLFASNLKAWNCSDPLASRVDVGTTKPAGVSAGDGDGQYYIGSDAANKGDYYVCQVPKTATPKNGTKQKQGQKQSQNQNQTSTSQSTAIAGATSSSASTATGGSSQSNATGGTAKATGGNVSGSGNSTNTNTASASNNGNGANNSSYSNTTNVDAAHIPVNTAYAPTTVPTVDCYKTYSGGAQSAPFGISLGGGKIDKVCRDLNVALHAPNALVYCKQYILLPGPKAAGVTLNDCLGAPVVVPPTVEDKKITNTPETVPPASEPIPVPQPEAVTHIKTIDIGNCKINNGVLNNVCKRFLDSAIIRLQNDPDSKLVISGPVDGSKAVLYLRGKVDSSRIRENFNDDQNSTLSFQLYRETIQ